MSGWRVAVDRGGTFTDVVATDPAGQQHTTKVLSEGSGAVAAIRALVGDDLSALTSVRIGTTVATNALLTGTGARTALLITEGFTDLLTIGHQARPEIFALAIERPAPLAERVVAVRERVSVDGEVLVPLDGPRTRAALERLREEGFESVAIAFAHGVIHEDHERECARIAFEVGFSDVVVSHDISAGVGLVDRARAAVADARLTPVVRGWVQSVSSRLPVSVSPRFMTSTGGLVAEERVRGTSALLSGPAGGVVACGRIARRLGLRAVLGFDMGGTSTDVCRWAGELERRDRTDLAGRSIAVPTLDVVSVAAGGGSLLAVSDGRATVGPGSAGAAPGPACYGRGGPAAITDANLVLGRLQPGFFPAVFGRDGRSPLDEAAARAALAAAGGGDVVAAAAGWIAVANEQMAEAIAALSTARGHDPRDHALVALGGAAGQHACAVARRLGMRTVVVHPLASVLSAWGIAGAPRVAREVRPLLAPWSEGLPQARHALTQELTASARATLVAEGADAERLSTRIGWQLRYVGAETALWSRDRADFEQRHARLFGFAREGAAVEVLAVEVVAMERSDEPAAADVPAHGLTPTPVAVVPVVFPTDDGEVAALDTPVHRREELPAGAQLVGPALIVDFSTTVVVDPGWRLRVVADGAIELTDHGQTTGHERPDRPDPVGLELYHRRFMGIATRMGETLRRVAWSTNVKERLDFSCALFDPDGRLVANAPHIPVHLGAMGETVRSLVGSLPAGALRPGRSWAVNDPAQGGSHLPDITVITPVFAGRELLGFTASRGHHADVGGITPGSMPPFSTTLAEEGVLLRGLLLVDDGAWRDAPVRAALADSPWPARDPDTVVADLQAQVAANHVGVDALEALARRRGADAVVRWMAWIQDNGDAVLQRWLAAFEGPCAFADELDDGTTIAVSLRRERLEDRDVLVVDFSGTGPASLRNLNAPPAVTRAALLYVLRCCFDRPIPLNDGVLRGVDLRIPAGSILHPPPGAAVVGGNVETSQRVVDVLLGALGAAAASQGTMNNLAFGDGGRGYYETICGGSGATPHAAGVSGVHTHMTNTRLTDVEVLEHRYPVRVERFGLRRGSGGGGARPGGDGVVRVLRFLAPMHVTLLSQRRATAPFGLAGGASGEPGLATITRADGTTETLPGCFAIDVHPGDCLEIRTPGGGGFGPDMEVASTRS